MARKAKRIPRKEELFKRILAIDSERQSAVRQIEKELKKLYKDYFVRVRSLVATNPTLRKSDAMNLQATTKMMRELTGILDDAGFKGIVKNYGSQFKPLAEVAAAYYEPFGLDPTLAGASKESLQAYVQFSQLEFGTTITQKLIPPVQSALLLANYGSLSRDQVIDQVQVLQPTLTTSQATTFVDDSFAQFQRAVVTQKGEELGMEIYQYLGPNDDITSPQCRKMLTENLHGVPGMYYRDEIGPWMHPNLKRDPFTGGGHPRCRHQFNPVTLEYAIEQGFEPRNS